MRQKMGTNRKQTVLRISLLIFSTLIAAAVISYGKWLYLAVLTMPFLCYLAIRKPFIFPFGAYLFFIPVDQIALIGGYGGTTVTKYLGILSILSLLLKGSFERKLKLPHNSALVLFLFVLLGSVSFLWAIDPSAASKRFPTMFGLFLLYLVMASYRITHAEYRACKWFIILGGLAAAAVAIYEHSIGINYTSLDRATLSFGEETTDPNIFAFGLLLPASATLESVLSNKGKVLRAALLLVLIVILVAIFISGSRGGMVGVFVLFAVYLFVIQRKVTVLGALLTACIMVFSFVPMEVLSDRWANAVESGGAGRIEIWLGGLRALPTYWATGAGLSNFPYVYSEFGRFTPQTVLIMRAPHNIFLEIAIELGIAGLVLFLVVIWKHYRVLNGRLGDESRVVMLKAAFFSLLTASFFLGTLWTKSFWLLFMCILMHYNAHRPSRSVPFQYKRAAFSN